MRHLEARAERVGESVDRGDLVRVRLRLRVRVGVRVRVRIRVRSAATGALAKAMPA